MGLISTVKAKRHLAKLKERAVKEPSPATLGELVRYHIHHEDPEAASDLVSKGLHEFPDSEILQQFASYLTKSKASGKVKQATHALEDNPSPRRYAELIEIFRRNNDIQSATKYCLDFLKDYPESAAAHRAMGEIRLKRFTEDFASKDGRAAESALLAALEIDPEDSLSLLQLARLYYCCGLIDRSRIQLDRLFQILPGKKEALRLLELMKDLPGDNEDPDLRFSEIEERGWGVNDWPGGEEQEILTLNEDDHAELMRCFNASLQVEGVVAATYIGLDGMSCGVGCSGPGQDWEPFSRFVSNLKRTAHKAALRMDIGSLERSSVEGANGSLLLKEVRSGTLAFLFDSRFRMRKPSPVLRNLIEEIVVVCGRNNERAAEGLE